MNSAQPLIGITVSTSKGQTDSGLPRYVLNSHYVNGVVAGGGAPLQIPNGLEQGVLRAIFDRLDGLLLSGGGDVAPSFYGEQVGSQVYGVDLERDELEMTLVRWAVVEQKPLFAICRGIQAMNVALGGSLYQDLSTETPGVVQHTCFERLGFARDYPAHDVELVSDSRLARLLGGQRFTVNSLHHQGLKTLAHELNPVGHAADGLVEGVEIDGHIFAIGVQWHPEALAPNDPVMQRLFDGLVNAARNGIDRAN